MSVYTRIPEQLNDTAYDLFAVKGVICPRKSHSSLHVLEQKYCTLGSSVLSTENSSDFGDDISSMNQSQAPKRLKIPNQFLKEEDGMETLIRPIISGKTEKARQNDPTIDVEIKKNIQADRKHEELIAREENVPRIEDLGNKNCDDFDVATFRNRPTSKLIQDNQDLQKLFDSVRGKESQGQQRKKVGKLQVPLTFNADRNDEIVRGADNRYQMVNKGTRNALEVKDVVGVTFNDRKTDKEENSEALYCSNSGGLEDTVADSRQSSAMHAKQKISLKNDAMELQTSHTKAGNSVQSYWLNKQKQARKAGDEAGDKENMSAKNKMFMDDLNLATCTYGEMYASNKEQLVKVKLNKPYSQQRSQLVKTSGMDERSDYESLPGSYMVPRDDERNSKIPLTNGKEFNSVGKLLLPAAFVSNDNRESKSTSRSKDDRVTKRGKPNGNKKLQPNIIDSRFGEDQKNFTSKVEQNLTKESWNSNAVEFRDQIGQTRSLQELGAKEEDRGIHSSIESKQIGRLNINAIFTQEKDEFLESKNQVNPVIAQRKALFDQNSNKKTSGTQRGIGKLRVGSSKSERYEEIENLSPEGEVPSNMSNQMKEQLDKILQGRSESVSSLASLSSSSSKRNDNKEVGRLSLSSISSLEASLTSARTNEDFSGRSLDDDPFTSDSGCKDAGDSTKIKVNNGSLESQLGNIFQRKNARGGSSSSSPTSSLNTSLNGDGNLRVTRPNNCQIYDIEERSKRKMLMDEIKDKYNSDEEVKESVEMDDCRNEVEKCDLDENKEARNKCDYEYNESSNETNEDKMQKSKGKISIPHIFESKKEDGKKMMVSNNVRRGKSAKDFLTTEIDDKKIDLELQMNHTLHSTEAKRNGTTESSNNTKEHLQMVNSSKGLPRGPKVVCDKSANEEGNGHNPSKSKNVYHKGSGNHTFKRVNFDAEVGIIGEDKSPESSSTQQATTGKLSLSLLQSFDGELGMSKRLGTPGRDNFGMSKGAHNLVLKEERQVSPIVEEKKTREHSGTAREKLIPQLDEAEDASSLQQNVHCDSQQSTEVKGKLGYPMKTDESGSKESPRKVIGKLSIPAMFK